MCVCRKDYIIIIDAWWIIHMISIQQKAWWIIHMISIQPKAWWIIHMISIQPKARCFVAEVVGGQAWQCLPKMFTLSLPWKPDIVSVSRKWLQQIVCRWNDPSSQHDYYNLLIPHVYWSSRVTPNQQGIPELSASQLHLGQALILGMPCSLPFNQQKTLAEIIIFKFPP